MYKITFNLRSAIAFTDLPTFDALLAWCYMKQKYGFVETKLSIPKEEMESFDDLPLVRHQEGYFMASWLQYCPSDHVEFVGSWKKRWANQREELIDFRGKVKKVRSNAGEFKAYDMPIVLHNIKKVWFYFQSEDVEKVKYLIDKHLFGIGKKIAQGYGEISASHIEEIDYNPFEEIIRPIPAKQEDIASGKVEVQILGWKPPYWALENQTFCLVSKTDVG